LKQFAKITGDKAGTGSVHRADFLDQMIGLVKPESGRFGHTCESYEITNDGITLHFSNQPDATADVVIACDGVKSRLRKCMWEQKGKDLQTQQARYAEWIAWRGLIPIETFRKTMGADTNTKQMLLGQGRHILHFPVRGGSLINIVGFVLDREHNKLGDHTGPWSEPRPAEEMLEDFKEFAEPAKDMLRAIEKPSIWGIFDLPELDLCIDRRLVLTGDSKSATTPHQGSGAGQAVEDALFIAGLLCSPHVAGATSDRSAKVEKALEIFQDARLKRSAKVQRTSREAGLLYEFNGVSGEGSDVNKLKENLESRMDWIWQYSNKDELASAVARLQ